MECLRGQTPGERSGTFRCDAQGCEFRQLEERGAPTVDLYPPETHCVLQLQLRARDDARIVVGNLRKPPLELYPREWIELTDKELEDELKRIGIAVLPWQIRAIRYYQQKASSLGTNPGGDSVGPEGHGEIDQHYDTRGYN